MRKLISTKQPGIYLIKSKTNDKIYIGSAKNLAHRKRLHLRDLRCDCHGNGHLQNHYNKYGNDLEFFVLRFCATNKLIEHEQRYFDSMKPDFNICKIAGSSLGLKRSKETRLKQRNLKLNKNIA